VARPRIYIHRIGTWGERYLAGDNRNRLSSFAEIIDDSPLTSSPDDLRERLNRADGILSLNGTGVDDITAEMLQDSPVRVVAISHWFHGLHDDAVPIWKSVGIDVIDSSWGNNVAVAQWSLGAAITGVFRFAEQDRALRSGEEWPDLQHSACMLDGQRVGVVGLGRIGRLVADLYKPFNVNLVGYDKYVTPAEAEEIGVRWLPLDELMRTSDIITFHLPVTEETTKIITREHLESVIDGALIVNSARTAILDYDAFLEGLVAGRYRAVVDVFEPEPPPLDDPIRSLPNVVATPHIAGATMHMNRVCGRTAIDALRSWFTERGEL
jgi:phosphoglycerate dehydrogenase-like enzyme